MEAVVRLLLLLLYDDRHIALVLLECLGLALLKRGLSLVLLVLLHQLH
jgi:hypothetical protein